MKKQTPSSEDNWLYKDEGDKRIFSKLVCLPDDAPLWQECTTEEKEEFERTHPAPEPEVETTDEL